MISNERVAIVTGAARGIGLATAKVLAEQDVKVGMVDIDTELLQREVGSITGEVSPHTCDVSVVQQCQDLVDTIVTQYGRLDILINNAGICPRISIPEMTEEMYDKIMNINLKSIFFLSRAAAEAMKITGWGRIVNVSSTGGRVGGLHNSTVYSASKGGVLSMTKSMARHYAPDGILINAVAPGAVDTRMFDIDPDTKEAYLRTVPLQRMASPMEIAQSIVHLCNEETTWVTGATLDVNGGVVMV